MSYGVGIPHERHSEDQVVGVEPSAGGLVVLGGFCGGVERERRVMNGSGGLLGRSTMDGSGEVEQRRASLVLCNMGVSDRETDDIKEQTYVAHLQPMSRR